MSSKEIKISPELFDRKKNKTLKKPTGKQLKKELLQRLSQGSDLIQELDALTKEPDTKEEINIETETEKETKEIKEKDEKEPTFGCLKNGTKPTFRQLQTPKTVKQYSSFGKKNDTVRVLIKDKSTYDGIHRDVEKLKKHNMNKIRNFLRTKRLYKVGSTAPDDVLREIYINVSLTGEIENKGSDTMIHNYLHDTIAV
jgi:hypothetical protein